MGRNIAGVVEVRGPDRPWDGIATVFFRARDHRLFSLLLGDSPVFPCRGLPADACPTTRYESPDDAADRPTWLTEPELAAVERAHLAPQAGDGPSGPPPTTRNPELAAVRGMMQAVDRLPGYRARFVCWIVG
jgi:hypothetical protein